jgi:AraC-like DNA-binding protein
MLMTLPPKRPANLIADTFRLPNPANYASGVVADLHDLPDNVLLFGRRHFSVDEIRDEVHHRFILLIALERAGEVCLNEAILRLGEGQAVLVFPHQLHHYLNPGEPRCWLFITFEQPVVEPLLPLRNRAVPLSSSAFATLRKVMAAYLACQAVPDDQCRCQYLILGVAMLLQELRLAVAAIHGAPGAIPPPPSAVPAARTLVVEKLNNLIHNRMEQRLTQEVIARELRLSASRLRLLVRQTLGLSMGRYLMRIRLHRATALLSGGRLTVAEVAAACGFASVFAFSRAFKRGLGVPPSRFRNRKA